MTDFMAQRFVGAVDMAAYKRVNEKYTLEEFLATTFALAARNLAKDVNRWKTTAFQPKDRRTGCR